MAPRGQRSLQELDACLEASCHSRPKEVPSFLGEELRPLLEDLVGLASRESFQYIL